MEALSTMDILYTDKTGTLTYGDFQVVDYAVDEDVLKEVIYMEQQSSHPIGRAIVSAFKDIDLTEVEQSESIEEIAGSGIKKGDILVGKPGAFKHYDKFNQFQKVLEKGDTSILVADGNEVVGYFSFRDQIRPQSASTVADFQKEGIKVCLLTGDNEKVAAQVAKLVKVDDYIASMLPEDKIEFVMNSQGKEEVVGMIGDGINDAPALAQADVGIAMGGGSDVAIETAAITLMRPSLHGVADALAMSQATLRNMKQNLLGAFIYNVIGIPIAAGVLYPLTGTLLSPVIAGAAMALSSITVVANANRLLRFTPKKQA